MTNTKPTADSAQTPQKSLSTYVPPTPGRCFTGAAISGSFALALYYLTHSIIEVFANKPLPKSSMLAMRLGSLVRSLVIGVSSFGTSIFAITTLGLIALGIQLLIKQMRQPKSE